MGTTVILPATFTRIPKYSRTTSRDRKSTYYSPNKEDDTNNLFLPASSPPLKSENKPSTSSTKPKSNIPTTPAAPSAAAKE